MSRQTLSNAEPQLRRELSFLSSYYQLFHFLLGVLVTRPPERTCSPLIRSRLPRLSGSEGPSRMTERPEAATVNSLTQQRDHPGKTIQRERLICTRAPRPSCYYSVLQDDRVTPEGDRVMSRGDPEVGQLRGVGYVIHIHKRRPVVALNCLFCSSGPARCLNVKRPSRAAMLIRAIEPDCRV